MSDKDRAYHDLWDAFRRLAGKEVPQSEVVPTPKEVVREMRKEIIRSARKRGGK